MMFVVIVFLVFIVVFCLCMAISAIIKIVCIKPTPEVVVTRPMRDSAPIYISLHGGNTYRNQAPPSYHISIINTSNDDGLPTYEDYVKTGGQFQGTTDGLGFESTDKQPNG